MLRSLLALTACTFTCVAHADEVQDVLLLPGQQQLWIALEGQPDSVSFNAEAGTLTVMLVGFQTASARSITPVNGGHINAVMVEPGMQSTAIRIDGAFNAAFAELRQGGVLIDFSEGGYHPSGAGIASASQVSPATEAHASMALGPAAAPADQDGSSAEHRSAETTFQISQPSEEPPLTQVTAAAQGQAEPIASNDAGEAAPVEAVGTEVDVSTVPGEIDLIEADEAVPGPCDPTAAAVTSSPWDLDALAAHAACLIEIGETVNGAGLYERVLAFEPGHFQAALGLARLREREGRRDDAARLFETAADAALTDGQALAARQSARRLRDED